MAESVREFFETLPSRVDETKAAGVTNSYLFDVEGAGQWLVDVDGGRVNVTEGGGDADVTIATSEENFMRIVRGEQSPTGAYMTGKVKVEGDISLALRLRELLA